MAETNDRPKAVLERWPVRIRQLQLLRRELVTPRMLRITLGGDEHVGFESHIADEHVKLLFPSTEAELGRIPVADGDRLRWPKPLVPSRDYTVRSYDPQAGEVEIDVVMHEHGVASTWAREAPIGADIWLAGPPRGIRIPAEFTWQCYLGDETALPAIARRLAELDASVTGLAVIEINDDAERQPLVAPPGVEVRWLSRDGTPAGTTTLLADAARTIEIPSGGGAYVWYGGEQAAIKPLRAWVKAAGLGPGEFDFTGYWRRGAHGNQLSARDVAHALKHLLHIPH